MKKFFRFNCLIWPMVIIVMMASIRITSGQILKEQTSPIPENINKIFQASCFTCHGSNGKMLPMAKLNFSKWADYGAVKEAEKASKICSEITDELMPPKSIRKSNPELIPTKEQIELICKWAESLKPKEAGK
jgi:mono/diheme cytochrome c family protein